MHYALREEWEQAYRYAVKAIAVRHRFDMALISLDFSRQYETEALLHGGNQLQALLGRAYDAVGDPVQAQTAYSEAATIILGLAEGIRNEARRSNFLAGPQIQSVLQRV